MEKNNKCAECGYSHVDDIICDICGHSCNMSHWENIKSFEYATLFANWGYCSNLDNTSCECHMCEDCFDKVCAFIESLGGKVRLGKLWGK